MAFFDKKEEVLDIQLTRYGKRKLAQGKFQPTYYSFHDEGILYDPNYAGFDEENVQAQDRITEKTAYRKPQSIFSEGGADKKKQKITRAEESQINSKLGTADLAGQEAPAMHVEMLESEIESVSASSASLSRNSQNIPQINLGEIEYEVRITKEDSTSPDFDSSDVTTQRRFEDGTKVEVSEEKIMMAIDEENTPFKNNNFEIELFEVDKKQDGELALQELDFTKARTNESFPEIYSPDRESGQVTSGSAEYYLEFNVDEEISRRELCRKLGEQSKDIFEEELECSDIPDTKGIVTEPDENPYSSNVEPEDTEDKC